MASVLTTVTDKKGNVLTFRTVKLTTLDTLTVLSTKTTDAKGRVEFTGVDAATKFDLYIESTDGGKSGSNFISEIFSVGDATSSSGVSGSGPFNDEHDTAGVHTSIKVDDIEFQTIANGGTQTILSREKVFKLNLNTPGTPKNLVATYDSIGDQLEFSLTGINEFLFKDNVRFDAGKAVVFEGTVEFDSTSQFDGASTFNEDSTYVADILMGAGQRIDTPEVRGLDLTTLLLGFNNANAENLDIKNAGAGSITVNMFGNILPDADNTHDLGSAGKKWATGHFTTLSFTNITISGTLTASGTVDFDGTSVVDFQNGFTATGGTINMTDGGITAINIKGYTLSGNIAISGTVDIGTAGDRVNVGYFATINIGTGITFTGTLTGSLNASTNLQVAGVDVFLVSGSKAMTGNIDMATNDLVNVGDIGIDTATFTAALTVDSFKYLPYEVFGKDATSSDKVYVITDGSSADGISIANFTTPVIEYTWNGAEFDTSHSFILRVSTSDIIQETANAGVGGVNVLRISILFKYRHAGGALSDRDAMDVKAYNVQDATGEVLTFNEATYGTTPISGDFGAGGTSINKVRYDMDDSPLLFDNVDTLYIEFTPKGSLPTNLTSMDILGIQVEGLVAS